MRLAGREDRQNAKQTVDAGTPVFLLATPLPTWSHYWFPMKPRTASVNTRTVIVLVPETRYCCRSRLFLSLDSRGLLDTFVCFSLR